MNFCVSAPGKVILFGEHSVVYGHPAIAAAINIRCEARISRPAETAVGYPLKFRIRLTNFLSVEIVVDSYDLKRLLQLINLPGASLPVEVKKYSEMLLHKQLQQESNSSLLSSFTACLFSIVRCCQLSETGLDSLGAGTVTVDIASHLFIGAGLGSSASFATVLAGSFLVLCGQLPQNGQWDDNDLSLIHQLATQTEALFHYRSSGIDTAVAVYGGLMQFQRRSTDSTAFHRQPLLSWQPPDSPLVDLLIVNSKISRSTAEVCYEVTQKYKQNSTSIESLYLRISNLVTQATRLLPNILTDATVYSRLTHLLSDNHRILQQLGVSLDVLDTIVEVLSRHGIHAKLTGAGKGGCVIALLPADADVDYDDILFELDVKSIRTTFSTKGVCLESQW